MKVPILKGERLVLRPVQVKDAPNYVRWFRDKEVMVHFNQAIWRINLDDEKKSIRKFLRSKDDMNWAIEVKGKHIGGTGIKLDKINKTVRWGIVIGDKQEWGNGYAVEAAKLCAEYVFTKLRYERIDLFAETENKRAISVYKKVGFKLEGVLRSASYNKLLKKRVDSAIMSILKEEWI
ncbi:MAG: GNAT family protein [Candidatus Magasanikbacteria bacterium]